MEDSFPSPLCPLNVNSHPRSPKPQHSTFTLVYYVSPSPRKCRGAAPAQALIGSTTVGAERANLCRALQYEQKLCRQAQSKWVRNEQEKIGLHHPPLPLRLSRRRKDSSSADESTRCCIMQSTGCPPRAELGSSRRTSRSAGPAGGAGTLHPCERRRALLLSRRRDDELVHNEKRRALGAHAGPGTLAVAAAAAL